MASSIQYPKVDLPCEVEICIGTERRKLSDTLAQLTITPYSGFWGVDEIWKMHFGGQSDIAYVRTLANYPTKELAQAYIEGFLAGRIKRKKLIEQPQPDVTVRGLEGE